ncbi:hypothetical protein Bpfe_016263, partial [Biomphalaria pfeifferi]
KEVYIPASSTVFLQDYNIYLNKVNSFKFYLSACTDVKIYLWVSNSTTSYPTLGGSRGEYIAIYLG